MHSVQPCLKRRSQRLVINTSRRFAYWMCFHPQLKYIFNTCQTLQSLKTEAQGSTLRYFQPVDLHRISPSYGSLQDAVQCR